VRYVVESCDFSRGNGNVVIRTGVPHSMLTDRELTEMICEPTKYFAAERISDG
jgi:hypothetical protein